VPILCLRTRIRVAVTTEIAPGSWAGSARVSGASQPSIRRAIRPEQGPAEGRERSAHEPAGDGASILRLWGGREGPGARLTCRRDCGDCRGGGSAFTGKTRSTCPILRLRVRIALPLEARVEPSAGILRPMIQESYRHLNGPEGRSARTLRTVVQELCCRRAKAARAVGGTAAPGRRRSRRQRPLDRPTRTAARFRRQRFGLLTISRSCSGTQVKVPYTAPRGSRPVLNGVPQRSMSPILVPCRNSSRRRSSWT